MDDRTRHLIDALDQVSKSVYSIRRGLNGSVELQREPALYAAVALAARDLLCADCCDVWLYQPETEEFRLRERAWEQGGVLPEASLSESGLLWESMRTARAVPVLAAANPGDQLLLKLQSQGVDCRSALLCPMLFDLEQLPTRRIGVLAAYSSSSERFSERDSYELTVLAKAAAAAIEHGRLVERLLTLAAIARELGRVKDYSHRQSVFSQILENAISIFKVARAELYLHGTGGLTLAAVQTGEERAARMLQEAHLSGRDAATRAIECGHTVQIEPEGDSAFGADSSGATPRQLAVPIIVSGEEPRGAIVLTSWRSQGFGIADEWLLQAWTEQVLAALASADRIEDLLTAEFEMTRYQGMVHGLRGRVAAIRTELTKLASRCKKSSIAEWVQCELETRRQQMGRLQDDMYSLSGFGLGRREGVALSLNETIREVVKRVTAEGAQSGLYEGVRVNIDELSSDEPEVTAPVPEFGIFVTEQLIENARYEIKRTGKEGEIRIRTVTKNQWVLAYFEDSAPGVPPEHQARLFEPRFTTKELGRGMGLFVAQRYVKKWGGSIRYEDAPRKAFVVEMLRHR